MIKKRYIISFTVLLFIISYFSMTLALQSAVLIDGTLTDSPNDGDVILKVGLAYGTNSLPAANLANEVGRGYSLGYFDENRNFVYLIDTDVEKISIMKDEVMYINSDDTYTDVKPASLKGTIYICHAQTVEALPSCEEAKSLAEKISSSKNINAFPAYINSEWHVRVGSFKSKSDASQNISQYSDLTGYAFKAVGYSTTCYTVTKTKTSDIIFEFDNDGQPFGVMPLSKSGKSQTWFKGFTYYGGFEYNRINGGNLTVINIVGLHDYIKGVIPYEMSSSWPEEALKAQAMCAKSYALSNIDRHKTYNFDVCNTVDCQVYMGTKNSTESTDHAVDCTYGKYITYNGENITPFYHSSNGGSTENSENVWSISLPYLRAVKDNFEDLDSAMNGVWQSKLDLAQITETLKNKGYDVGTITDVYVKKYTEAGNVYSIAFVDNNKKEYVFEKESARTILNSSNKVYAYSMRYRITGAYSLALESGNGKIVDDYSVSDAFVIGSGGVVKALSPTAVGTLSVISSEGITNPSSQGSDLYIRGSGWGHNVGMSQWGARGMAEQGYSYEQILKYYYTGVEITDYQN